MRLSAILPLPTAERPAAVLTELVGQSALIRMVQVLIPAAHEVLVVADDALAGRVRAQLHELPVHVIAVGPTASRADCLGAAAARLQSTGTTHVLVADHRQPLISPAVIARVTEELRAGATSVVPVLPVTDTVKVVDVQGTITSTVDRSQLQLLQSPHGMVVDRMNDSAPDFRNVTAVAGDPDAVVADLPADTALLEAIISCRS